MATTQNKRGRPTKEQAALNAAQKLARQENDNNLKMYIAIRDGDEKVLAQFDMTLDDITPRMKMDASKEIGKLAMAHLKELEGLDLEGRDKVKKMSGVQVATFRPWSTEKNKKPHMKEVVGISLVG
ncbi:hypothetical protein K6R49_003731 [Escherichia coli]|uniref:hypothetical protein n=1 Tax=Buttiauxella noackiae TaxID=82992 RepID=UPI0019F0DFEA|nr:hypothetical protein [Escherichia coli]MBJ0329699.1 hypothetical protein [Escherichia coli]